MLALILWQRYRRLARERFIREFALPRGLYDRLRKRRPELELKDCALVARGLRQFFLAYLNSGCRFVAMPSQAVDDLWHEFILYTRAYEAFCGKAFGGFLHHTPAVVLSPDKRNNEGLRRVWWQCCKEENIDPRSPLRLPLLFAIDAKLGIADGFVYKPDCKALQGSEAGTAHCGADFSDSSIDGGTDGFADGAADGSGDGGGCGGGCGGGGD
jgi:hypothetical protein